MPCPRDDVTSKIEHMLLVSHYMGLCVFSLPIPIVMIERIYTLSYHHHQIGSMNYHPLFGLGHETMVCALYVSLYSYANTFHRWPVVSPHKGPVTLIKKGFHVMTSHDIFAINRLFTGVRKTRSVAWTLRFELTKTTSHHRNYFTTFSTVAET